MPVDSDTESDSSFEVSQTRSAYTSSKSKACSEPDASPTRSASLACNSSITIVEAVDRITQLSAGGHKLESAANTVIQFLRLFKTAETDPRQRELCQNFSAFVNPLFMKALFHHRKQLSGPFIEGLSQTSWADALLAHLADAVTIVAGGFRPLSDDALPPTMLSQREKDSVRAASLLPSDWFMMPDAFVSQNTSPATKRIALRLLFGTIALRAATIAHCGDFWSEMGFHHDHLLRLLEYHLMRTETGPVLYSSSAHSHVERQNAAMIVCIYAASSTILGKSWSGSVLKPCTLSRMLEMISLVVHPDGSIDVTSLATPLPKLDAAQAIVLSHIAVRWCWETWDDYRLAGTDIITSMTVNWIHHSGMAIRDHEDALMRMRSTVSSAPYAAGLAFMNILYHVIYSTIISSHSQVVPSSLFETVLFCYEAISHVLMDSQHGPKIHSAYGALICRYSCILFIYLKDDPKELRIKNVILQALGTCSEDYLRSTVEQLQQENQVGFRRQLDQIIQSHSVLFSTSDRIAPEVQALQSTQQLVHFLTHLWHCGAEGFVSLPSISSLASSTTNLLLYESRDSSTIQHLGVPSITILIAGYAHLGSPTSSMESAYRIAAKCRSSRFAAASSLACYILKCDELPPDLPWAELWDYLRDMLQLILGHRICDDDEPLAVLASKGICTALRHLLRANAPAVQFMLSSPWTRATCEDLRLLQTEPGQSDRYRTLLSTRLKGTGHQLLDDIRTLRQGKKRKSRKDDAVKMDTRDEDNYSRTESQFKMSIVSAPQGDEDVLTMICVLDDMDE